ncbi:hypothetical protein ABPG77_002987 [Micractinium sp. CCAP 211/92]
MAISVSKARLLPFTALPRITGVRRAPCSRGPLRAVAVARPRGSPPGQPAGDAAGAAGVPPASGEAQVSSSSGAADDFRAAGTFLLGALTWRWWSGANYQMGDPFNGAICAHLAVFCVICAIVVLALRALVTVAIWLCRRR